MLFTWSFVILLLVQLPHQSTARQVPAKFLDRFLDQLILNTELLDDVNQEKYAVMFDAGSSGTRVKVYKYIKRNGGLKVEDFKQLDVPKPNKVKPGLSAFAKNTSAIGEYLKPLLEAAKRIVPDDKEASTSLRLFATAGMRLLKDTEVKAILDKVDALLTDKAINTFSYKKGDSKVISGQDEAVYDWVTVNFLKGAFSGKDKKTYGALDMGGASHQNAFQLKKLRAKYKPDTVHLDIAGKSYNIFAHSYLGGGEAEARAKFLKKLVENQRRAPKNNILYSPCHNYGIIRSTTVDSQQYEIRGAFHGQTCQKVMKKYFFCNRCEYKNQPKLIGDFYSFSVFSYAFKATGIVTEDDQMVPISKIDTGLASFCTLRSDQFDYNADPYPDLRCFQLNYIKALLKYGYRVGKQFRLYNAAKLNGFDLNWAIGAMLVNNDLL